MFVFGTFQQAAGVFVEVVRIDGPAKEATNEADVLVLEWAGAMRSRSFFALADHVPRHL